MPRQSKAELLERRRREAVHQEERFSPLRFDFVACDCKTCAAEWDGRAEPGEVLLSVGGRWDKRRRDWAGDSNVRMKLTIQPEQLEAVTWFDDWLDKYLAGYFDDHEDEHIASMLLAGGRRSGKTYLGLAFCIAFAIAVPGAKVWVVAPTESYFGEPRDYLDSMMPAVWYSWLGFPHWTYYLVNGSEIVLRSGNVPKKLKKGICHFALFNEGQQQKHQSLTNTLASVADTGGCVTIAANPPDEGDEGDWVGDMAVQCEAGERRHARFIHMDPMGNTHIKRWQLEALAEQMDAHEFDIQIRGKFLGPRDLVLWNWSRMENERPAPELQLAITPEVTRELLGRSFDAVVGVDIQSYPFMAAGVFRAFPNPRVRDVAELQYWWLTNEVNIPAGDEYDVCDGLAELDLDPYRTLIILDASGFWQNSRTVGKNVQKLKDLNVPDEWIGRSSAEIFEQRGWVNLERPDPKMRKNPDVLDRCRVTTGKIRTKSGNRYAFADPRCRQFCESIRKWKNKPGAGPSRRSRHAHNGDVFTYVLWHLFPRTKVGGKFEYTALKRFERKERTEGWT